MNHNFDVEIAKKCGVHSAIILNHLYFWIEKNKANDVNFYDGYYWTYSSKKAFTTLFPYMTARQIDYAMKKLINEGLIITGNYNKSAYDRTLWYAITNEGYSILQNCEMGKTKLSNEFHEIVEPIPDINTYISTNNIKKERKGKTETEKNNQGTKKQGTENLYLDNLNKKDVVTDKSLQSPKQLNANILTTKDSISQTTKESQGKRKSFNEIIEEYTDDVELQSALKEHLRVRVANKKGLTNGILEKALKRLSELTHKISEKIAIVNNAIASGNVTFYPLSDRERKALDKPSYNIEEYENYDIMDYCNMLERHEKREREQASKWRHEFLGEEYDAI